MGRKNGGARGEPKRRAHSKGACFANSQTTFCRVERDTEDHPDKGLSATRANSDRDA